MNQLIVGILLFQFLFETGLDLLNVSYRDKEIDSLLKDIYSVSKYKRWTAYQMDTVRFRVFERALITLLLFFLFLSSFFASLNEFVLGITNSEILGLLLFYMIYQFLFEVVSLPFQYYYTFSVEERHHFNQLTKVGFFKDFAKNLLVKTGVGIILFGSIFAAFVWIGTSWIFLGITYGVIVLFLLFSFYLHGTYIRLFFTLKPLEEGQLKEQISFLVEKTGFEMNQVYVMDASSKSTKLNAFFSGLGKRKQVVLYDTLLNKMNEEEILAVLAHELGHAKHKDTQLLLIHQLLILFVVVLLFGILLSSTSLFVSYGFTGVHIAFAMILIDLFLEPFMIILSIGINYISRKMEFRADQFAAKYTSSEQMMSALKTLTKENLINLSPHPVYVMLKYNHPTIMDRLKQLEDL